MKPWKVVLGTDGSDTAAAARDLLKQLPFPAGSCLHITTVLDPTIEALLEQVRPEEREHPATLLTAESVALQGTFSDITSRVRSGEAAHELLRAAREFEADLLVLGSRGLTGLAEFVLGSVARNVARHAPVSVLITHPSDVQIRRVLVAVDGSPHGEAALRFAREFPLPLGAEVHVVHVVRPMHPVPAMMGVDTFQLYEALDQAQTQEEEAAHSLINEAVEGIRSAGRSASGHVQIGDPALEILKVAGEVSADLLILGARGVSLIEGLLLGSVADRVLKRASCAVLLAR